MTKLIRLFIVLAIVSLGGMTLQAQEQTTVTDDDINAIAKDLYCPVCENIPLDACGTAACDDWRYEIRLQLEDGKTREQIVDDFVVRFGDRVVGTPQDPLLRAISLVTPWVATAASVVVVIFMLFRWRGNRSEPTPASDGPQAPNDSYRTLLEQDLAG